MGIVLSSPPHLLLAEREDSGRDPRGALTTNASAYDLEVVARMA